MKIRLYRCSLPGLFHLECECVAGLCPHHAAVLGLGGQPVLEALLGLGLFEAPRRHLLVLVPGDLYFRKNPQPPKKQIPFSVIFMSTRKYFSR